MWTRFTFEDIRIIAHYLGTLTSLFTVALLIPLITALVFQEWEPATRYFLAAGISLTIGSLLRMAKVDPGRLTRQQAMALTGFAWMFLAFIASVRWRCRATSRAISMRSSIAFLVSLPQVPH